MTDARPRRAFLPLFTSAHSNRSSLTCRMRCGNACDHAAPNTSGGEYFGDIMTAALSRRRMLQATAVVGAAAAASSVLGGRAAYAAPSVAAPGLRFTPIAPSTADAVVVPAGYEQKVVLRWGDPILAGAPAFDPAAQSAAAQQGQFGYNNDFLGFFDLDASTQLMMVNHEYTDEYIMFPGYDPQNPTREQVEIAWAAHGLSVVAVQAATKGGAESPIVGHPSNRRIHTGTAFKLTGPVAGHDLVKTAADPTGTTVLGTLNNCSGGLTPWGTWLTAEENFNQYFANADLVTDPTAKARLKRYGVSGMASERKWERFDDRFDLAKSPNEVNRFGWIVEVDPFDPTSTPKKRTALGRFKHEAANVRVDDNGRVAVYMGDDERFDYFYKFVSNGTVDTSGTAAARANNAGLLDDGTLYVARFSGSSPAAEIDGTGTLPTDGHFDGSGTWIKLASGSTSFVPGMSAEEVYLFTRQAGDAVGATKMDRPEDVEPHPITGTVYIALTNNTKRTTADEANPRTANKHGHVMEVMENGNASTAESFSWSIFLLCGDPNDPSTYFAGADKSKVSPISCPDNVTFDKYGNLWISTDGNQLGAHDRLYGVATEGKYRGEVRQFLSVPTGAETCGPWVGDERVFVCVQHPGETDDASYETPSSHWPDGGSSIPRPSVVGVWNTAKNGKVGF
ncbi:PhoX family protein [Cumulibacter manganitolerans]|uniref:PhoX family protein n=1 Tax=Cumulibacter manganitolerans TaxID=1884992 RepID=UPI00129503A6|nr:PhoX family phosphatase [Cumulibacter manganitolerans]